MHFFLFITQDSINDWGYVFVLGGDSFVKTTDEAAGDRGGGYTNDVWVTEGSGWAIYSDGSKPMAESTMRWDEVNSGRLPPAGLMYEDWIVCQVKEKPRKWTAGVGGEGLGGGGGARLLLARGMLSLTTRPFGDCGKKVLGDGWGG